MAQEIEKKYLVLKNKLPKLKKGVFITQGYLCYNPLIRFRIIGNEVWINIKKIKKGGFTRDEWEFHKKLDKKEIKKIIKLSIEKPIYKIRYKVKHKGSMWEIDVYQRENKGLITAEIEIPSKNSKINFPEWINKKREITNDKRYFNRNLGKRPYKTFKNKI